MNIEYRAIDGFPGYFVGNDGSVWCDRPINGKKNGKWKRRRIKPFPINKFGHLRVDLHVGDGLRHIAYVHRLVLEAFVGPCPEGMEARHFPDRNPRNNCVANLSWDSHEKNCADMLTHGTRAIGEKHSQARLTVDSVRSMRADFANGIRQKALAKKHGISQQYVSSIVTRKRWGHVD